MSCNNLQFPYLQQQQQQQQQQSNVVCSLRIQNKLTLSYKLHKTLRQFHEKTLILGMFFSSFTMASLLLYATILQAPSTLAQSWLTVRNFARVKQFNVKIFYLKMLIVIDCGVTKGQRWFLQL